MGDSDKFSKYTQLIGKGHLIRENIRDYYTNWRENHPAGFVESVKENVRKKLFNTHPEELGDEYLHIFRKKTRWELVRISAAVTGIEFSYAAETAFVSPTLLKIGVEHKRMTLVWALSPLVGFFLTPILGSLSDRCSLSLGRRRPFIILMTIGVIIGLILVPNGEYIGYSLGDPRPPDITNISKESDIWLHRTTTLNGTEKIGLPPTNYSNYHPWGVFLTILGTVLLDFNADGCQSPARAYLLDVTIPEDHAKGLSTFTIMAGLGGFFGYAMGGIDWDTTALGQMLGGHVRAVFTLITGIFIACVSYTITSFREIPLKLLDQTNFIKLSSLKPQPVEEMESAQEDAQEDAKEETTLTETSPASKPQTSYGATLETTEKPEKRRISKHFIDPKDIQIENGYLDVVVDELPESPSVMLYLKSIIFMPNSLKILCLTNLFCWMAHVCYSLYFTDFVGEAVFKGNPTALLGTESRELYEAGVRFGCWGMSLYSLSCACYSLIIEKLINRHGARRVYVCGLLVYCTGMFLMTVVRNKVGVIVFSWTAGVMYSTLFTMPYLLVSEYHERGTFELKKPEEENTGEVQIRGLGTDIAIVSSMVFLAQFILSMCMGTIVSLSGTTTAVVAVASALSFCGAISATQVMYLD